VRILLFAILIVATSVLLLCFRPTPHEALVAREQAELVAISHRINADRLDLDQAQEQLDKVGDEINQENK
jgi:hypothetical protein